MQSFQGPCIWSRTHLQRTPFAERQNKRVKQGKEKNLANSTKLLILIALLLPRCSRPVEFHTRIYPYN